MIRPYHPTDKKGLLTLLKANIPQYFAASEESDFVDYLDQQVEDYFVFEEAGAIIGAGGINYFPETNTARISWDMVHPDFHGKGIGRKLTLHRINRIKQQPEIRQIVVRTSQLAFKFYQKLGFELQSVEKDFWVAGFDLYLMTMDL